MLSITELIFYIIESVGILAFAISGILLAKSKNFDPVGIYIISFTTALGGGTIRDVFLDKNLYWINHPEFAIVIFLTVAIFYIFNIEFENKWLFIPDSLGLSLFAINGAKVALSLDLNIMIVLIIGTVSATFGGVIRDIMCQEIPKIFQKKVTFYSIPCFFGVGLYVFLDHLIVNNIITTIISISFIFIFRILAHIKKWSFN